MLTQRLGSENAERSRFSRGIDRGNPGASRLVRRGLAGHRLRLSQHGDAPRQRGSAGENRGKISRHRRAGIAAIEQFPGAWAIHVGPGLQRPGVRGLAGGKYGRPPGRAGGLLLLLARRACARIRAAGTFAVCRRRAARYRLDRRRPAGHKPFPRGIRLLLRNLPGAVLRTLWGGNFARGAGAGDQPRRSRLARALGGIRAGGSAGLYR